MSVKLVAPLSGFLSVIVLAPAVATDVNLTLRVIWVDESTLVTLTVIPGLTEVTLAPASNPEPESTTAVVRLPEAGWARWLGLLEVTLGRAVTERQPMHVADELSELVTVRSWLALLAEEATVAVNLRVVSPVAFAVFWVRPEMVTPLPEALAVAPVLMPEAVRVILAEVPATMWGAEAGGFTTMVWTNRAVTLRRAEAVTVQVLALLAQVAAASWAPLRPESPGPATFHPAKLKPAAGTAVRVTGVLSSTTEVQVVDPAPQSMLPGLALTPAAAMSLLVTVPPTVEADPSTVSATLTGDRLPPLARLVDSTVVESSAPTKLAQLFGSFGVSLHRAVWASS